MGEENVEINNENYCDLCTLSTIFKVNTLKKCLVHYLLLHSRYIDLIIKLMIEQKNVKTTELFLNDIIRIS